VNKTVTDFEGIYPPPHPAPVATPLIGYRQFYVRLPTPVTFASVSDELPFLLWIVGEDLVSKPSNQVEETESGP